MAKGSIKSVFKDAVLKPAGGSSDLELEGGAKYLDSDFNLGSGKDLVIQVGEGQLKGVLDDLE